MSHSIAYALPAMAAVSASGFVAGARLARNAFRARRRAPEAPKVRFSRAQPADTSRRRGTDARFPNDKCQTRRQSAVPNNSTLSSNLTFPYLAATKITCGVAGIGPRSGHSTGFSVRCSTMST